MSRMERRDPVEAQTDDDQDLYDVATWEPRTALDRLAIRVYGGALAAARAVVILLAVAILLAILAQGITATFIDDPLAIGLVVLSVLPALALAAYVYATDITTSEPLELVVATFILGVLFAGFAAIINSILGPLFRGGEETPGLILLVGFVLFYYLVVGPVEESVKLLAVRLHAYRDDRFNAVIDGAVYGAVAGLGFATIENALYITSNLTGAGETAAGLGLLGGVGMGLAQVATDRIIDIIGVGGQITALRALAGPGHVIYSAFAGYYLGLAKFNPGRAGPIVTKGLLIAAFIHATYNTLVSLLPPLVTAIVPGTSQLAVFFGFVVVYDGLFFYVLLRKLGRYRRAYKAANDRGANAEDGVHPEKTEFDA